MILLPPHIFYDRTENFGKSENQNKRQKLRFLFNMERAFEWPENQFLHFRLKTRINLHMCLREWQTTKCHFFSPEIVGCLFATECNCRVILNKQIHIRQTPV